MEELKIFPLYNSLPLCWLQTTNNPWQPQIFENTKKNYQQITKDFGRTSFIIKLGNFKYVKIPFFTSEDVQQQQKSNWYNDQGKIWDLHDKLCRPSIGHPLSKRERY